MRLQGEIRELSVTLTTEELEDRGADLAAAVRNADQEEQHLEGRKKAWKRELDGLKEDLKGAREEASKLAEIVRTGREKRDVACNWQYALEAGYAFLVRSDTQELVTHRKLRDEERQMEIGEAPFAEPTPEQLEEWLRTLPVNEEQALPEGHAGEVGNSDLWEGLDTPENPASDDDVAAAMAEEFDDDPACDTEEEMLDEAIDDAIVPAEHGEPLEEPLP